MKTALDFRDEAAGIGATPPAAPPPAPCGTPLIAREAELRLLHARLADPHTRVLTVTGPVGVGKSRLVAAAAADGAFAGAARTADLAGLAGADVRAAVRAALPAPGGGRFLLVLDGCDDALAELRSLVPALVAERPEAAVVLAACEPLGVYGEEMLRLDPLALPGPGAGADPDRLAEVPAVRLFLGRARAVRPGFVLDRGNAGAVARLCARTDGLPLALELAAARMRLDSPQGVVDALDTDLDVLSDGGGETLSRHGGVRQALEWSLARLADGDRELLARIAVFRAGADVEAAASVAGLPPVEARRGLERLADRGLLHTREADDGVALFRPPELVRRLVTDVLLRKGEADRVRRAHADHFLDMARALRRPAAPREHRHRPPRVRHWRADVEEAMRYLLVSGDDAEAVRLASALGLYWRGYGGLRGAAALLEEVLDGRGAPPRTEADGLAVLGELLMWLGEHADAERRLARARTLHRALGDAAGEAADDRRRGALALHRGDAERAVGLLAPARDRLAEAGADHERAAASRELADALLLTGACGPAREAALEALRLAERLGDERAAALAESSLAEALAAEDGTASTERRHRACLDRLRRLGDLAGCAVAVERLAVLRVRRADAAPGRGGADVRAELEETVAALGAADAMRTSTGCTAPAGLHAAVEEASGRARELLGPSRHTRAWSRGSEMGLRSAVAATLAPAEPSPRPPRSAAESGPGHRLSPRELEVAELVAEGLTNREVARRLDIAEWTAINHLRKVMRKLDCTSRVQVAGWFTRAAPAGDGPAR
ncbi:ATP-binding protein [Nocardiopsis baichengensis]|uniref:ATP-binding protein n=1 Tax=Nocardiopsis baichengensis TaxID=280240 RepID=UPI0003451CD5|nr:LuxR C-terminal-related transcriptional regulator [Nocardiopsis baichengensis]